MPETKQPKEGEIDPVSGEKWAFLCCPGCGHNYFDAPLVPASKRPTGPKCKWCIEDDARPRPPQRYDDDDSPSAGNYWD